MYMSDFKALKQKKLIRTAAVILLLLTAVTVWWLIPVRPLHGCEPEEITRITVTGFPGAGTVTLDAEETLRAAENLYQCKAKRAGISFGRMGWVYQLHIFKGDSLVRTFSVIGSDRARDSMFFYKPASCGSASAGRNPSESAPIISAISCTVW